MIPNAPSHMIPSGIFLGDLILIDEGNPDMVTKESSVKSPAPQLINLPKYKLLQSRIYSLLLYQKADFNVKFEKIEPLFTLLNELPGTITGKELYHLSIEKEPPERESTAWFFWRFIVNLQIMKTLLMSQ